MPAEIGATILTAELASTAIVGSVTVGTAVGYAVVTGATIGAQFALSALTNDNKPKAATFQTVVRQAIPPRFRHYGLVKVGGAYFFHDVVRNTLVQGIIHGEGEIHAFQQWTLDDVDTELAGGSLGGTNAAKPWVGNITIESHLGTPDQGVSPALAGNFASYWGANRRLRGLCYSVIVFSPVKKSEVDKIYPGGANPPTLRVVLAGAKLYDPRNGATYWTANSALVLLDYLTHPDGCAIPLDQIDIDSFADFANVCDQQVMTKSGITEPRYRAWGSYSFDEDRATVLKRILATCDADLYPDAQGRVSLKGGRWVAPAPDAVIHGSDILGWGEFDAGGRGAGAMNAFNRLKASYTSQLHGFQPTEMDPWDDDERQAASGVVVQQDMDLRMVPSHAQARRIAKIEMAKGNPRYRFTGLVTTRAGLVAFGERVIRVVIDELAGLDAFFRVTRFEMSADLTTCEMDLASIDASVYAWSAATEEGNAPGPPGSNVEAPPPVPTGIAFSVERTTVGQNVTVLRARFTAAPVAGRTDLTLIGRYRIGGGEWSDMGRDGATLVTGPLNEGSGYVAQLAWDGGVAVSDWSEGVLFSAVADPNPPAPVYNLGGSVTTAAVSVTWINGGTPSINRARVYRGPQSAWFGDPDMPLAAEIGVAPNSPTTFSEGLPAANYRYFVTNVNASGVESQPNGPVDLAVP